MQKSNSDAPAASTKLALAGLSLSMLMPSLDTSIANAGLPALAQAFGASFQAVQWIVLAYLLAITTLIVSAGRLGDLVGRRRLLSAGVTLFTVASLACGLATTLPVLIAARAAQGLGAAVMMALAVAMVGEAVPKERTGSAMGLLGMMSAIGTTLGPSLGGVLIASIGWRFIFLVNVPLGIVNLLLVQRFLPADAASRKDTRFDHAGTVVLALSLGAYALAMTLGRGSFGTRNAMLLGLALAGAAAFVAVEMRSPSPLVRLSVLPVLGGSLALSALVATVMMTTLVVGPFYLSRALGLSPLAVGIALSAGPLMAALTGVPAGRLVDRLGAPRMTLAGLSAMACGTFTLSMLPSWLGLAGYVAPILVVTSGYALFQTANNTAAMTSIDASQRGVASGLLSLSRNLGLITGASAMGAVFSWLAGGAATAGSEAIAAATRHTFAVAAGLVVIAIVVATRSALMQPASLAAQHS